MNVAREREAAKGLLLGAAAGMVAWCIGLRTIAGIGAICLTSLASVAALRAGLGLMTRAEK